MLQTNNSFRFKCTGRIIIIDKEDHISISGKVLKFEFFDVLTNSFRYDLSPVEKLELSGFMISKWQHFAEAEY